MFWKFLLAWTVVGAVVEYGWGVLLGIYFLLKMIHDGVIDASDPADAGFIFDKFQGEFSKMHHAWADGVFKVLPNIVARSTCLVWSIIVWPLELILSIKHAKEAENRIRSDLNKAS